MKYYPQFSYEHILYELNLDMGWALICWAIENDGWMQFSQIKRTSPGYIAMEIAELERQYYAVYGKKK